MEFANGPQTPAVAGFSETGRAPLNRGWGAVKQGGSGVTVGCLGAERTPFMREGSCREAVGTPQGATLLDRGAISHE